MTCCFDPLKRQLKLLQVTRAGISIPRGGAAARTTAAGTPLIYLLVFNVPATCFAQCNWEKGEHGQWQSSQMGRGQYVLTPYLWSPIVMTGYFYLLCPNTKEIRRCAPLQRYCWKSFFKGCLQTALKNTLWWTDRF